MIKFWFKSNLDKTWSLCDIIFVIFISFHSTLFLWRKNSVGCLLKTKWHFQRHATFRVKLQCSKKNSSNKSRWKWQIWYYKDFRSYRFSWSDNRKNGTGTNWPLQPSDSKLLSSDRLLSFPLQCRSDSKWPKESSWGWREMSDKNCFQLQM